MRVSRISIVFIVAAVCLFARPGRADGYENERIECGYIVQCSMSRANSTVGKISTSSPGYGALNDWRIGNGRADSVDCGTQAIGAVGLLYGIRRLNEKGRADAALNAGAKTALSAFFVSWINNPQNRIEVDGSIAFPCHEGFDASGRRVSQDSASPASTAEILIAMRKYCLLTPNADAGGYQFREYGLACSMANYIVANLGSWTVDRSYAVAAYTAFSHWAAAVGDKKNSRRFAEEASTVSGWILRAQNKGEWRDYYDYLDGGGNGVYNNSNADQTGFSPYEFDARPEGEKYASELAVWWDKGKAFDGDFLSVQTGPGAGGVHQSVPADADKAYPGDSFQLADAEWKIARADGNLNDEYAQAWKHYNFALSAVGSPTGSGCWVNNASADPSGFLGGFIDWVDGAENRPAVWQRFIDTSGYMIVATEELVFSNEVDWSY